MNPILDVATQTNWHHAHQCVYVRMTGLTPEERFQQHLRGEKDAWFVHKYGQRLLPEVRLFVWVRHVDHVEMVRYAHP